MKRALLLCILAAALLMVGTNLRGQEEDPVPQQVEEPLPQFVEETAPRKAEPLLPTGFAMQASNIQLDGVIIWGGNRKALVRLKVPRVDLVNKKWESPFITVREGQDVEGFRVVKIEPKSISVEKDGKSYTINLHAEDKVENR